MILSSQLMFSDNQAITGNTKSTNVVDLGQAGTPYDAVAPLNQDVGKGNPIPILVQVTEDFAGLTQLQVRIQVSANDDLSAPQTLIVETIVLADLVQGQTIYTQVLPNGVDQRYLGLDFTVIGGPATAGQITAAITMGNQTNFTGG